MKYFYQVYPVMFLAAGSAILASPSATTMFPSLAGIVLVLVSVVMGFVVLTFEAGKSV